MPQISFWAAASRVQLFKLLLLLQKERKKKKWRRSYLPGRSCIFCNSRRSARVKKPVSNITFIMTNPGICFVYFGSFQTTFYRKIRMLQRDSNSDHQTRRQARWPLGHPHGPLSNITSSDTNHLRPIVGTSKMEKKNLFHICKLGFIKVAKANIFMNEWLRHCWQSGHFLGRIPVS